MTLTRNLVSLSLGFCHSKRNLLLFLFRADESAVGFRWAGRGRRVSLCSSPKQRRGSETLVIASGKLEARPMVAGRTGPLKKGLFTAVAADWRG